ncbi:MAG: hypothetical protein D4S01_11420 [Dehalococcoidia bacterium]|nr:MAG: hypothetical protein D4S01_11420 [Dehalococcoidia bacterium]
MLTTINNRQVNVSNKMLEEINVLSSMPKGGFATLCGYVATSGRVAPEVADINFTSRFSTENLYKKKLEALKGLTFEEVTIKGDKLKALSVSKQREQFKACVDKMMLSLLKTLEGERTDAHRQSHDEFYIQVCEGVKLHLETIKGENGTELVLDNDAPIASSIMVSCLDVGKKVIVKGEYKKVNSGTKVLMDNCINNVLKEKGVKTFKTRSLKEGKYDTLKIGGKVI